MTTARRIGTALAAATAVFVLTAAARNKKKPGNSRGTVVVQNYKRTYELHLPATYHASRPLPLVIVLHGRLGDGHGNIKLTHFDDVADKHGFVVAYPDGLNRSWADGRGSSPSDKDGVDDVKFVASLIDKLSSEHKIDPARVYVTGMSNGGFLSQRVACELSRRIAAVGIVAATMGESIAASCHPARAVPILMIQGSNDPLVPVQGGGLGRNGSRGTVLSLAAAAQKWVSLDSCRSAAEVFEIPDAADDGTSVRREIYSGCSDGSAVEVYLVQGGGHTWPGGYQYLPKAVIGKTTHNLDASETIWEFFSRHPLKYGSDW